MTLPGNLNSYDPTTFVGRRDVINEVTGALQQVLQGIPPRHCVFFCRGIPGIGKSALLGYLADRIPAAVTGDTVVITLSGAGSAESLAPEQTLLDAICDQLSGALAAAGCRPNANAGGVADSLAGLAPGQAALLLLDDGDAVPVADFRDLEEGFFLPLVASNRAVVVVAASPGSFGFRRLPVRTKTRPIMLRPLSESDTEDQAYKVNPGSQRSAIFAYSGGYPLATRELAALPALNDQAAAAALAAVETRLLRWVDEAHREAARRLAVLRVLGIETARTYLSRFGNSRGEDYRRLGDGFYLDFLGGIAGNRTAPPAAGGSAGGIAAYDFSPAIRYPLLLRLRVLAPDDYQLGHAAALDIFCERLRKKHQDTANLLLQALYHRAALSRWEDRSDAEMAEDLRGLFDEYLTRNYFDADQAVEFENSFGREVYEEFRPLPRALADELQRRAQDFARHLV